MPSKENSTESHKPVSVQSNRVTTAHYCYRKLAFSANLSSEVDLYDLEVLVGCRLAFRNPFRFNISGFVPAITEISALQSFEKNQKIFIILKFRLEGEKLAYQGAISERSGVQFVD